MARKSKKTARVSVMAANTAALREHTRALNAHSKILKAALSAGILPADRLMRDTAFVESTAFSVRLHLSKPQIKEKLAQATSNEASALKDTTSVTNMIGGDSGVADIFMSKINQAFWPGARAPHLTFDRIKNLNIGQLVDLIDQLLQ
jgi:hypothetical protein